MNFLGNNKTVIGLIALFLFSGCIHNDPPQPSPVTSLVISSPPTGLALGQTFKVSAFGVTASGNTGDPLPVVWTSSDPSIATVNTEGIVSGNNIGVTTVQAVYNGFQATAPVGVVSTSPGAANLSVSGFAYYQDRPYNLQGFTGDIVKTPIRRAKINLMAIDGFVTLASTLTGEDGSYQFAPVDNTVRRGGVYVQVLAKTDEASATPITVMDNAKNKNVLAVRSLARDDSIPNSFTLDILVPASGIGGAFNILDTLLKGGTFIQKMGVCPPPNTTCKFPPLTAYWTRGVKGGTFYESPPVNAININGDIQDADEYDDAIIAHEYGHFAVAIFSRDDSPGGAHSFYALTQDIRLAWSEGWATFFAAAALGQPFYVDTQSQTVFSIDLEALGKDSKKPALYTTSEAAVSRVLWDMFDTPLNDDDPMTTAGFRPLWKTITEINNPTLSAPVTIEPFVLKFTQQNPVWDLDVQTVLQGAQIELFPDSFETTEESLLASLQHHTLYITDSDPFTDQDKIPISVIKDRKYTVRTLTLTNGADTFLTVEDFGGAVLYQNDNLNNAQYLLECNPSCPKNDPVTLSSLISFTAPSTGTFFVKVQRSPNAPLSTGRAGSYDIQVLSP